MNTNPPTNTPHPTLEVTPVLFAPTGVPPTLLVLPVPNRTALTISANLHTPEAFPPHLAPIKTYMRGMLASYPPMVPTPLPTELSFYLNTNSYLVAFSNTTAIAFLLFTNHYQDIHPGNITACQLDYVLVHPQWRRRATAFYLLQELVSYAVRQSLSALTAMVPGLPEVVRFVQACGFVRENQLAPNQKAAHVREVWLRTLITKD